MQENEYALCQPQKVVRCHVTNSNGDVTMRFIELEDYKLWEYMMQHKHGMQVDIERLCVWLVGEEYLAKEQLYSRSGSSEQVERIVLRVFDESKAYYHTINRFYPAADSDAMKRILLKHVPDEVRDSDRLEMFRFPGYCIESPGRSTTDKIVLGLEGNAKR